MSDLGVIEARALFPRGLAQPGHYRFAVDALLLAAFAAPKAGGRGLDLGAGCGVVGLALLLGRPGAGLSVTAVDADPAMAAAARANAARLLDLHWETVRPHTALDGGSIRGLNVRGRTGVSVVGRLREGHLEPNPDIDIPLAAGDILVLLGAPEQIETFRKTFADAGAA